MNSGTCPLCPSEPWDDELGVQNFPRKPAKKPPRVERTLTCVVIRAGEEGEDEYLLTQRLNKGQCSGDDMNLSVEIMCLQCYTRLNRIYPAQSDLLGF